MRVQFVLFLIICSFGAMLRPLKDVNKEQIIDKIRLAVKTETSPHYHRAYNTLAYYVDTFGPRMWGSKSQQLAIDALYDEISKVGFDRAVKENLGEIKTWVRGNESLILKSPRKFPQRLNLIGLGKGQKGSVKGQVLVVNSFDDLKAKQAQANGKIICYNVPWINYSSNVQYRSSGATVAQSYGAIGVLIRSVTPTSLDSPHTGGTSQSNTIPAAAISLEDADMFQRMQDRGQTIEVELDLDSSWLTTTSDNVIAELKGTQYPDQIILIGGHWDSWDTGSQTGANDDGGGVITCYEAIRLLKDLGIKTKRTIRFIAWSGEEMGLPNNGAENYAKKHGNENHILAFESDLGSTKPYGFGYNAKNPRSTQIVAQLVQQYLYLTGADLIVPGEGESVDSGYLEQFGIPLMRNLIADNKSNDFYFRYHHSAGDSMSMMNANDLDDNVVAIASMIYLIADNEETLPK